MVKKMLMDIYTNEVKSNQEWYTEFLRSDFDGYFEDYKSLGVVELITITLPSYAGHAAVTKEVWKECYDQSIR
jgi:hypothetical protein